MAASHARPRLVLAQHPRGERFDAFWLVGGRVVDWGPLGDLDDVGERTARALRGGDGTGPTASLTPDEVDDAAHRRDLAGPPRGNSARAVAT